MNQGKNIMVTGGYPTGTINTDLEKDLSKEEIKKATKRINSIKK